MLNHRLHDRGGKYLDARRALRGAADPTTLESLASEGEAALLAPLGPVSLLDWHAFLIEVMDNSIGRE